MIRGGALRRMSGMALRINRARAAALLVLAGASLGGAGCGGSEGGGSAGDGGRTASAKQTVQIASYKYLPETVEVQAGGSITWKNEDDALHNAQTDDGGMGAFDTKDLDLGDSKRLTFEEPGTYSYYCIYHRFMEGTVEVVPSDR